MPVIRPSFASSAIFWIRLSGFTWNGSSVTTRVVRPLLSSSTSTTARMVMEPRPVRYASWMPRRPTICAAVGKSGPLTRSSRASSSSSSVASKFCRHHCAPAATSRRLCGGILVAIATAMPSEPFTSRFGNRAGSTTGSADLPS